MKRLFLALGLVLLLTGCRNQVTIRPDTIVDIPLNPTMPPWATQPATEEPTEAPTQKPTEPPTEKPTEKPVKETAAPTEKATLPPTEPPTQAPTLPVMENYQATELDLAIMEAVNAFRAQYGLPPLVVLDPLVEAAALRCSELPLQWKHIRPDGTPFTTALTEVGLEFSCATESILVTAADPHAQAVVDKLAASDTHRPELLEENALYIGAAHLEFDGAAAITILIIG